MEAYMYILSPSKREAIEMKIRKIIIIPLVVLAIIIMLSIATVAAISYDPLNLFKQKSENGELNNEGELVNMIQESNNYNVIYDDLLAYSYDSFMLQISQKKPSSCPIVLSGSSGKMNDLISFNDRFPIKKLSIVNEDCVCAEYKLDRNGELLHAFVVFEKRVKKADNADNYELWQYYGELYFAYPNLTSDNFTEYAGMSLSIDESPIFIDLNHTVFFNSSDNLTSLHSEETVMLKDGFMVVDYIVDTNDDSLIKITDTMFIAYDENDSKYPYNSLLKYSYVPEFAK